MPPNKFDHYHYVGRLYRFYDRPNRDTDKHRLIIKFQLGLKLLKMSEQQIQANRLLVNRFYHEFWNERDFEIAEEILTEDITFHGALGTQTQGIDGLISYIKQIHNIFPDFSSSVEEMVAEEQKVAACLAYRGTHEGEIFGVEPMGKPIHYVGVGIFIFRGDQISHAWELGDRLSLLQQLNEPEIDEDILDIDTPPSSTPESFTPELE